LPVASIQKPEARRQEPVTRNQHPAARIQFQVEDTGIGISEENVPYIFEAFFQGERKGLTKEGTGLGLAIAKKLVELMKGNLSVESEVGKGSTFTIELELKTIEELEARAGTPERLISGYKGERKHILIVDDNPANLAMLVSALEPLGFEIDIAENGREALDKTKSGKPDLLLLDLLMPVLNGQEVLTRIKNNDRLKQVKVIGVTAAVADKERMEKFRSGCDECISKPINVDILLQKLEEQLGIEWTEEEVEETVTIEEDKEIKFPPKEILKEMIKTAEIGNYKELQTILDSLGKKEMYAAFCRHIQEYIKEYDDDGIIRYLQTKEHKKR
jgi:CheY-like chemotaxis protein